ncbi:hypothetical protein DL96DRAFT_1605076 [Flagelloscypha sp. PMI_526]|nr:hypothetical protein DL96DRAFT_1605076 [Flagelloscypha sp. PMI_526]
MNSPKSIYNSGSIGYRLASILIGKPLWWALEQTGVVGEDSYLSSLRGVVTSSSSDQDWYGEYVVVPLLEDAANKVLLIQSESSNDGLYDYDSFRRVFSDALTKMREPEARLLVKFLQRDRGVVVSDGTAIKFLNTTSTPDEKSISAIDHGILELRTAVFNLHKQVDDIQDRCETLTRKAKDALARTQKTVALSNLRMKKQLESELGKRLGALENLETTLLRVESARGDTEQINEALHDGGHLATGELEALVRAEQRHQLPDLPNAPTTPVQETKPEEMKQPTLILETS